MVTVSIKDIDNLHEKYSPNKEIYELVYQHSKIVWEIARSLLIQQPQDIDAKMVKIGCLLHGIGVYTLYDLNGNETDEPYIRHGINGYNVLKTEGFSEEICRFAANHTGVGITKDAVISNNLPLPAQDFTPKTPEERLIAYADKFHTKINPPKFYSYQSYKKHAAQFGQKNVERFETLATEFGLPDLEQLAKKYKTEII